MKAYRPHSIFLLCAIAVAFVSAVSSCKKQVESHPSWDMTLLTPLLQSSLSLDDLVADSLLQTNADNSVSLVFSQELYSTSLQDNVFKIPDTSLVTAVSLQNLNLANKIITTKESLGQICLQMGGIGLLIIAANGTTFTIPPFVNVTAPDNDIDATDFFESADVETGSIDLTLENGLPIAMTNLVFQIKNKIDQQIITTETFTNLQPGDSQTKTIDLSGKHVEGTLVATITDFDSPGGTVVIDTSDAITLTMKTNEIHVSSATAVFPSQNLIDKSEDVVYSLSGGAELNTIHVKSGKLVFAVSSTLPQQSHFEYALPSVKDAYGNSIFISEDLPPAPVNGTSSFTQTFDLAGYTFDLTGVNGDQHNTLHNTLIASIDSTGELVYISKSDSLYLNYQLQDIVPDYLSGYVGQQIVNVSDQSAFDAIKNLKEGTISFEDAEVSLGIHNGIGVEGRINLYDLTSINSSTGQQVSLTWNQLGKPLSVSPATEDPFTPSFTSFLLNNSNSNIQSLISNLPDQLKYSLDIFVNPNGNTSNYHDFAYDSSSLSADLDVAVPLSLIASGVVLADSFDFSMEPVKQGDAEVKNGTFTLIVDNGFPIDAQPQLFFCDENYHVIDSLFSSLQTAAAGALNDQCMVSAKTKSELQAYIDDAKMLRIRSASKVIVKSKFNTAVHPLCTYLKIYDDYSMDVKLTGEFTFYTGY